MIRLAALFGEVSPREAEQIARNLRFSNAQIAWIAGVVEHARRIEEELASGTGPSPATVRQWIAKAGRTRIASVMRLVAARFSAQRNARPSAPSAMTVNCLYRRVVRSAFRDPVELGDLAVDGDDLHSIGVAEGPEMGWVLHRLLDVVLEDPRRNTVDELQRLAGELLQRYRNGER